MVDRNNCTMFLLEICCACYCVWKMSVGELCLTNATKWKALDSMVCDVFVVSSLCFDVNTVLF